MLCIREAAWDGQEWGYIWHLADGQEGANPRRICCGSGEFFTIIDPAPAEDRAPTCRRCLDIRPETDNGP